jgi:predicted RNase H-like nuclease
MINITKRAWRHILKYHTGTQPPKRAKKSTFNHGEDLVQLLNEAARHPPLARRGKLVRTFDAGHEVRRN